MSPADRIATAPPIARSIFLLVVAVLVAATLATVAITFGGPPPREAPVAIESVAAALQGEAAPQPGRRPLMIVTQSTPPAPAPGLSRDPRRSAQLAGRLGVTGEDVSVYVADGGPPDPSEALRGDFMVAVRDGAQWRRISAAPDMLLIRWLTLTGAAMLGLLLLLALPAWAIARRITRPLVRLADFADDAGLHEAQAPIGGPPEVVRLAGALEGMRGRLARQVATRTTTLAAIAHDLGTPLSRLSFRVERLPAPERDRALADIAEMRAMIDSVLRLGRDSLARPAKRRIDLASLLDAIAEDARATGQQVTLADGPPCRIEGDPAALRRMIVNLVDNAIRFGGSARIGWEIDAATVTIFVDDDGPGIDPALGDTLFEPFVRAEPSRNRTTGGTGLGLAIVRAVAEAHGGSAALVNRAGGGARASVRLPRLPD